MNGEGGTERWKRELGGRGMEMGKGILQEREGIEG